MKDDLRRKNVESPASGPRDATTPESADVLARLKPQSKQRVYDLVAEAGIDTSDWSTDPRPFPAANPKYCFNWSFEGKDRVVMCLWFEEMELDGDTISQKQNYREIAAAVRRWKPNQRKRAADMDHAIQLARNKRLPIRVIVVEGSMRYDDDDQARSKVETRLLDPEEWHVASYDDDGNCRLQRGPWPPTQEAFTAEEISIAGSFAEGAKVEVTTNTRERSLRLRDLARAHFAALSADGRLHCIVCDWAPPIAFELSGPIVEIHHNVGISEYPNEGRSVTFDEALKELAPLCPNCHRVLHAKPGGGTFTIAQLRQWHGRL